MLTQRIGPLVPLKYNLPRRDNFAGNEKFFLLIPTEMCFQLIIIIIIFFSFYIFIRYQSKACTVWDVDWHLLLRFQPLAFYFLLLILLY